MLIEDDYRDPFAILSGEGLELHETRHGTGPAFHIRGYFAVALRFGIGAQT